MDIIARILDLIYPGFCEVCASKLNKEERYICALCLAKIRVNAPPFCRKCSRQLAFKKKCCYECKGKKSYLKQVWSWAIYEGTFKECMHAIKYRKKSYILNIFGKFLKEFTDKNSFMDKIDMIVPVPLHESKLSERTFNQAHLIGKILAVQNKKPLKDVLFKAKNTEPQHSLTKYERAKNVKDAFAVCGTRAIAGKSILVVDDIFTTGATLNECARVLLNAGAKEVYGFSLSRGS
jgi:competence protein ComFC